MVHIDEIWYNSVGTSDLLPSHMDPNNFESSLSGKKGSSRVSWETFENEPWTRQNGENEYFKLWCIFRKSICTLYICKEKKKRIPHSSQMRIEHEIVKFWVENNTTTSDFLSWSDYAVNLLKHVKDQHKEVLLLVFYVHVWLVWTLQGWPFVLWPTAFACLLLLTCSAMKSRHVEESERAYGYCRRKRRL